MQSLSVDLHVHTLLSPCADIEMIPPFIVSHAQDLGVGAIAITDHNSAANVRAVVRAAQGTRVVVFPGMEVQTREEVHVLCLFDEVEQAEEWQEAVFAALPDLPNREEFFGAQYVVDAAGEYVRTEDRLLSTSTLLSIEQVVERVHELGGACLPAHVDRPSFSLLGNLGFVPPGLPVDGLELSRVAVPQRLLALHPSLAGYGLIVNSDAHRLAEMGARTCVRVTSPTVSELRMALAGQHGRSVHLTALET